MNIIGSYIELVALLAIWSYFLDKSKRSYKRMILISIVSIAFFIITNKLQMDISIILHFILVSSLIVWLYQLDTMFTVMTMAFSHIAIILIEFIQFYILQLVFPEDYVAPSWAFVPLSLITLLVTIVLCKSKLWLKIIDNVKNYVVNINIKFQNIWIINALFYGFVLRFIWINYPMFLIENRVFFSVIFVLIIIVNVLLYKSKISQSEKAEMEKYYLQYYPTMINIIEDINAKQHEYKNHLNTINGIIEVSGESLREDLKRYVNSLNSDYDDVTLINSKNVVLNSIIYSKSLEAKALAIDFDFQLEYDEEFPLADFELTEILSNLINNAFEQVRNSEKKTVKIKIFKDDKLHLQVSNSKNNNDINDISKLTKRGFSTKNKKRGYGLYNIKRILSYNKGQLSLIADKENTIFDVTMPIIKN